MRGESHVWHMQEHSSKASVKINQVIIAIFYVELSNDGYVVSSLREKQCHTSSIFMCFTTLIYLWYVVTNCKQIGSCS